FLLTLDELTAGSLPAATKERVAERRANATDYRTTDVPDLWEGMPERIPLMTPSREREDEADAEPVTGTPVSPGVVTATARLILDPIADEPLEPGEVLVCRTTDPSWASPLMLPPPLLFHTPSPLSHRAH